jgi:hypothetical protein
MKDELRNLRETPSTKIPKAAENHIFRISPEKAFAASLVCNSVRPPNH